VKSLYSANEKEEKSFEAPTMLVKEKERKSPYIISDKSSYHINNGKRKKGRKTSIQTWRGLSKDCPMWHCLGC